MSHRNGNCLCLRLSCHARHSQIDFEEIEMLADNAILTPDKRDVSVYYLSLPKDFDTVAANRIISTLVTKPYIDEAWLDVSAFTITPT